jgi:tetratricopeptide (TPR) repeat protein
LTALEAAFANGQWDEITPTTVSSLLAPPEVDMFLGYARLAQGQMANANGYFLRARSDDRTEVLKSGQQIPLLMADTMVREGKIDEAIKQLESVSESSGDSHLAKICHAILLVNQGKSNIVSTELVSVEDTLSSEACVIRGLASWKAGQSTTALTKLQQAVLLDPADGIAWNSLGVIQAKNGNWTAAAREFELSFRLLPDLTEARENWRLANGRAANRGTTIASTRGIGEITIVSASEAGNLRSATQIASEMVRKQFGEAPLVTSDFTMARTLSASGPVILQRNDAGLNSVEGDGMLKTLRDLGPKPDIHVVSFGYDSAEKTTMGILRYQNTTPKPDQAHIGSIQMLDPSEVEGLVGRTPFVQTDLKSLAANAGLIGERGVPVAVYTTQDKFGLQHIGNIKTFEEQKGIDLYVTPWQGHVETGIGLDFGKSSMGVSLGVQGANDKVLNREISTRDWTVLKNGVQQQFTGPITDLGKDYFNSSLVMTKNSSPFNDRGGIAIDAEQMRSEGGRVVFGGKPASPVKLKLVYPVFCIVEEVETPTN